MMGTDRVGLILGSSSPGCLATEIVDTGPGPRQGHLQSRKTSQASNLASIQKAIGQCAVCRLGTAPRWRGIEVGTDIDGTTQGTLKPWDAVIHAEASVPAP